jgi:hypothetical protein
MNEKIFNWLFVLDDGTRAVVIGVIIVVVGAAVIAALVRPKK